MKPRRCWINQPSTLQPLHRLHGANVIAVEDYGDMSTAYLTSGPIISMLIPTLCLSEGWRPSNPLNKEPLP